MMRTSRPSETELIRLCRAKNWGAASQRATMHPLEAMPTSSAVRGETSTALAVAIRSRAPIQVVQGLINANFHQIQICHLIRGSIVHEALKHQADDEQLECVVRAAVDYEVQLGKKGTGILMSQKDELGRTALHYMIDRIVRSLDRGMISRSNWDVVRMMIEAHPRSVSTIDADGSTPLVLLLLVPRYFCSMGGMDLEEEIFRIVQLMLELCPNAVQVSRRLPRPWHYQFKFTDKDSIVHGDGVPNPLSCALLHGRPLETVHLLLDSSRKLGANACRTVVTHHHEVALHIAASMRSPVEIMARLVKEDQGIMGVADTQGLSPLDWVWVRHILDWCSSSDPLTPTVVSRRRYVNNDFLEWHKRVTKEYVKDSQAQERGLGPAIGELVRKLKDDLFCRISIMLPAMVAARIQNETSPMIHDSLGEFPLLHAACCVDCPLAMVEIAFQAFPESIRWREKTMGRLPLHFASSRGGYTAQIPIGVTCNLQSLEELSPLKTVLSKFPEACRVVDDNNQLPLHIAIDHEKKPSEQNRMLHCQNLGVSTLDIQILLDAYPDSLQRRDGKTKLLPFQQAAEGPKGNIDVTFELLRRDPSLILRK